MIPLNRLLHMGLPEIICRGKQQTFKWMERVRSPRAQQSLRHDALQRFIRRCEATHLLDAMSADETLDEIISTAERLLAGRFDLLGYRDLDFGSPIDWHFDPVSGIRTPIVHWTRIRPLDRDQVGDSKVIWELNRHQWLVRLGQAWRVTGDRRYAEAVVRTIDRWLAANPRGIGINWASSLEVALRLIAWCWAFALIHDSGALTEETFSRFEDAAAAHATHVERYLSFYFSPNTHLTGEALGLYYAGIFFPHVRQAKRWRETAARILTEEATRQILPDGIYFERSTCYQRYTADIYLHYITLAERIGDIISPAVRRSMAALLDATHALTETDGRMPMIGDADGGCLLPLRLRQSDPPAGPRVSRVFPDGGLVVMRGADRSLTFDAGPLGCHYSSGHGHADLLSITCSAFGQPFLVDPGTYSYTGDRRLRDHFRGTSAHSTITIDGRGQAEPAGPFSWRNRPAATLHEWKSNEAFDFADASHQAYAPVSHRRRVIFVKERYWIIVDDLEGTGTHDVDVRFQFAPLDVQVDGSGSVCARAKRSALFLRTFATVPMSTTVHIGELSPPAGWFSPEYGRLEPAPLVVHRTRAPLPLRVVTLLWPEAFH